MPKKIVIAGTGLGGLATALRMSSRGYQVVMLEKHHQAGGRLNQIRQDGFTFDLGPSFFSMSYEFEELFRSCGIENPLQTQALDPLYTVHIAGQERVFNIFRDLQKLEKEFAGVEPDLARKADKYLSQAGQIFHDTENRIVKRNHNSRLDYLGTLAGVPLKHLPKLWRSMWSELSRHFDSEEVKVIFSLVAFFLGSTPFDTPAVYSLLNYTELKHDGYWNVKGGMYRIVETMLKLLEERGVELQFDTEIKSIKEEKGRITALTDQHGHEWQGDIFVVNADAAAFRGQVLKRKAYNETRLDKMHWTLAPFTIYLGVEGKIDRLHHHNYFLGSNFREYADTIFKTSVSPEKPYYYVNVSSRSNPGCAPEGCENLFILCPVPDLRYKADWSDAQPLANNIIEDLSNRICLDIKQKVKTKIVWTPEDWQRNFNLYRGSGLGLAHDMNQVGAFRPANKDEVFPNMYYVGASTVPGTGLPIVIIGSRLVAERIVYEHPTL